MKKKTIVGIVLGSIAFSSVVVGSIHSKKNEEPPKFSDKWFKALSDIALKEEREKVRKDYCTPGGYERSASLLNLFDKEMDRRIIPSTGSLPHREHGWYLPNDD